MTNILKTQFYRLKKSKLFWTLFGVTAVLPLITMLLLWGMLGLLNTLEQTDFDIAEFGRSLGLSSAALSEYGQLIHMSALLAVICSAIFLSRDFSYGTFRNAIVANHSRLELYLSHLLIALTIGASFMCVSMLSTIIFFGASFGFVGMSAAKVFGAIALAFAMGLITTIFVQSMMCMFLFATRRLAPTLACTIVICLVAPSIFETIVQLLQLFEIFAPDNAMNLNLTWVPLYNATLLDVGSPDGALVGKILLYIVPLEILFVFLGWIGFRKADLK